MYVLLNAHHHYFSKALVEDSHVFKSIFHGSGNGLEYLWYIIRRNCLENPVNRLSDLGKSLQ